MIRLFTDTDCDVTPEIAKKYGYTLISMPYVQDDKEYFPYITWEKFNDKEFYDSLREGRMISTSALPPTKYVEIFEPVFAAGDDIFYVHFSSAMSGTFNSMRLALEELKEKYPERKLYEFDTKGISALAFAFAEEVGEMFKNGKSVEEVLKWAETEVDHYACYFYADNLKFFAKSGRVSGLAAVMGGIIGLHPIINMDCDGVMKTKDKSRGKKQTLAKIVQYVESLQDNIQRYKVYIPHSDCLDIAKELANMLEEKFGILDIEYTRINPTIGGHCGPDCVGVVFHSTGR